MTVFSSEYHVGEDERKNSKGYYIAAVSCIVALIALGLVMVFVGRKNAYEGDTVPSFEKAIDEGNYSEALAIYRGIQDEVLSASPEDQDSNTFRIQMLDEMENIVSVRVDSICDRIIDNRYILTASDINFLDSMEELTSSVVSGRMYGICENFLLGKVEKPVVMYFFEQLQPIGNFSATANPLLRELDFIETATGDVQTAEAALSEGDYVAAVLKYMQVNEDYDGFVVLHGTDTMAYTASALSYMLENLTKPVIFTGSQLPIGQLRTDGKENLITSIEIAAAKDEQGHARVPEVGIYFNGHLLRGNRTTKQSAEEFNAFESFNYPHLVEAGVNII